MDTIERATAVPEQVVPSPEKEQAAPSEEKKEPTVGKIEETPEFKRALGKSTVSLNKQVSLHQKEVNSIKAEMESLKANTSTYELKYRSLQSEYDDLMTRQFADDPEARKVYLDKRLMAEEKQVIAQEKAAVEKERYEVARIVRASELSKKADELVRETGIDRDDLEECQNLDEMEAKAWRYKASNMQAPPAEPPQFDSAKSSAEVSGWSNEKIKGMLRTPQGIKELQKHEKEIIEAARKGRVK